MPTQSNITHRIIGALFLIAMAVAMAGNLTLMPVISADDLLASIVESESAVRGFGLLMLINSISVVLIGILSYKFLQPFSFLVATSYLASRISEGVILAVGFIAILTLAHFDPEMALVAANETYAKAMININWYAYHTAMITLGIGSLPFLWLLLKEKLVPLSMVLLGVVGYGFLGLTSVLAILDINWGIVVTLPVFLFEVVFGAYLIFRGFRTK
jgi:hypothetical protein